MMSEVEILLEPVLRKSSSFYSVKRELCGF